MSAYVHDVPRRRKKEDSRRLKWEVWEFDDSVQVKPTIGRPHESTEKCWCGPLVERYSVPLIIHRMEQ